MPEVPTAQEQGVDFEVASWAEFFGPAGTDMPIVARLSSAIQNAAAMPEVRDALASHGVLARASTPDELAAVLRETDEWARTAIKQIELHPE